MPEQKVVLPQKGVLGASTESVRDVKEVLVNKEASD